MPFNFTLEFDPKTLVFTYTIKRDNEVLYRVKKVELRYKEPRSYKHHLFGEIKSANLSKDHISNLTEIANKFLRFWKDGRHILDQKPYSATADKLEDLLKNIKDTGFNQGGIGLYSPDAILLGTHYSHEVSSASDISKITGEQQLTEIRPTVNITESKTNTNTPSSSITSTEKKATSQKVPPSELDIAVRSKNHDKLRNLLQKQPRPTPDICNKAFREAAANLYLGGLKALLPSSRLDTFGESGTKALQFAVRSSQKEDKLAVVTFLAMNLLVKHGLKETSEQIDLAISEIKNDTLLLLFLKDFRSSCLAGLPNSLSLLRKESEVIFANLTAKERESIYDYLKKNSNCILWSDAEKFLGTYFPQFIEFCENDNTTDLNNTPLASMLSKQPSEPNEAKQRAEVATLGSGSSVTSTANTQASSDQKQPSGESKRSTAAFFTSAETKDNSSGTKSKGKFNPTEIFHTHLTLSKFYRVTDQKELKNSEKPLYQQYAKVLFLIDERNPKALLEFGNLELAIIDLHNNNTIVTPKLAQSVFLLWAMVMYTHKKYISANGLLQKLAEYEKSLATEDKDQPLSEEREKLLLEISKHLTPQQTHRRRNSI